MKGRRSKFSLSNYKLLSFKMGALVPCGLTEVLPGDSIQQNSMALVRLSPIVAPIMHPVHIRIHHWYVPHRLVWDDFEDFITGGPDGMDASVAPYRHVGAGGATVGSLFDYQGIPTGANTTGFDISMLPLRGYVKIWNEWYRDQDLQAEVALSTASGADATTPSTLLNVAWEKDYFTSARPWSQKGPEVTLPIGASAPVIFSETGATPGTRTLERSSASAAQELRVTQAGTNNAPIIGTADLSSATAVGINELREAFALQRYEEARARYGSRYTEYLRYLGIRSSDARLQRPEYLGGGRQTLQISEVLQTALNTDGDPGDGGVGQLAGHGIGALRSNRYRRFFEEHGFIHSFITVKPRTMYMNGLPRHYSRTTKEDYFQKELQHIGQQEILMKEVYAKGATPEAIFGYQDRYDEYRRAESTVSGDFRTTLDFWHMARNLAAQPTLNASFIQADPTDRIFADQTGADTLWCMVNHSIQARRMLSQTGSSFSY